MELKAVLQWLAASENSISLRYFPFDEDFGPRLALFTDALVTKKISTGQLFRAIAGISTSLDKGSGPKWLKKGQFLEGLQGLALLS